MHYKCNNPECVSNTEGKAIRPIPVLGGLIRKNGRETHIQEHVCNWCYWILRQVVRNGK